MPQAHVKTGQKIDTSGAQGWVPSVAVDSLGAKETTVTPAAVALTANTSNTLLSSNTARIRATIYNPLATPLFCRKAASAATTSAGGYDFVVPPLSTWVSDPGEYAGEIRGICATAGSVNVSESV